MKQTFLALALGVTALTTSSLSMAEADSSAMEGLRESARQASKAERMPKSSSMVMFTKLGEAIVVADNPRWVVKGTLFDMWSNEEVHSSATMQELSKTLPLESMKIDHKNVLSVTVNQEKPKQLTVFLDPFLPNATTAARVIMEQAQMYRVRFIFTATRDESLEAFKKLGCVVESAPANKIIEHIINGSLPLEREGCLQEQSFKSYGLTQFLKIGKSPTLIASNDVYSEGLPSGVTTWLIENME